MDYFDRENAGQCGSCFNGTAAMSAVTSALRDGVASEEDLARLQRWSVVLRGRGACATLDAATNIAASLLTQYPDLVASHLAGDMRSMPHECVQRLAALRGGGALMSEPMKIKLDRTMCDGFGICAKHAPSTSHSTTGATRRWSATARCPRRTASGHACAAGLPRARDHRTRRASTDARTRPSRSRTTAPEPRLTATDNEAISGFVR